MVNQIYGWLIWLEDVFSFVFARPPTFQHLLLGFAIADPHPRVYRRSYLYNMSSVRNPGWLMINYGLDGILLSVRLICG